MLGKRKKEIRYLDTRDTGCTHEPPILERTGISLQIWGNHEGPCRVVISCMMTQRIMEEREAQMFCQLDQQSEDGNAHRHIVIADPASIKIYKLPWNIRLLRWLMNHKPTQKVVKSATIRRNTASAGS